MEERATEIACVKDELKRKGEINKKRRIPYVSHPLLCCSYSFCIYTHNFCINSVKKKRVRLCYVCVCGERGSLKYKEIPPGQEANGTWKGINDADLIRNLVVSEMAQGREEKKPLNAREKGKGWGSDHFVPFF